VEKISIEIGPLGGEFLSGKIKIFGMSEEVLLV